MRKNIYNVDGEIIGYVILTEKNKIEFHMDEYLETSLRDSSRYDPSKKPVPFFTTLGLLSTSRRKISRPLEV